MSDNEEPIKSEADLARSKIMSKIRSKNTKPELTVRRLVFSLGYRYRLHKKDLPGKPDLVFIGRRKVIFVHGCFWHVHDCRAGSMPKLNIEYWHKKLINNTIRDQKNQEQLLRMGWKILIVWECELKNIAEVAERIRMFLES